MVLRKAAQETPKTTGDADENGGTVREPDPGSVRRANKAAEELLKQQDGTAKTNATKEFFEAQIEVAKSTIEHNLKDPKKKELFDKVIAQGMKDLINNSLDNSGNLDYNKLKSKFFEGNPDDSNSKLKLPDEFAASQDADDLADEINNTFAKALLEQIDKYWEAGSKAIDKSNTLGFGTDSSPTSLDTVSGNAQRASDRTPREAERRHQVEKADKVSEDLVKDPNAKDKNTWGLKDIVKLAAMLLSGLKLLGLVWFLVNYALTHSGCMLLSCEKDDVYPISTKAACYIDANTQGKTIKMLNPNSGIIDFSSDRCNCSIQPLGTCGQASCKTPDKSNLAPWSPKCQQEGQMCSKDITSGCPLKYYSYKLFNPFQFFNDAGSNAANAAARGSAAIVKYMIIAGIICGVLLVLYIIYKYVASKKPAEAIKIEPSGSKFGNILGNLNKFSRYNIRPISYAPVKFGNRFNF